ncbi:hypothetical protein GALL_359230 [mine drainage metagenome]|uniref:Uncharacterized protein n=1 Tax=mine drainage metagenome TaxID=410659 RepID=A0A1J5QQZ5_9ZZZZ
MTAGPRSVLLRRGRTVHTVWPIERAPHGVTKGTLMASGLDTPAFDDVVRRLRVAGCVFAEDEARLVIAEARSPAQLTEMVERRIAGQPLDAGREDRRQHRGVPGQEWPQRGFGQRLSHRLHQKPYSFRTSATAPAMSRIFSAM